jgi:hypothetical protein
MEEGAVYNPYNLSERLGCVDEDVIIFDPLDLGSKIKVLRRRELPPLSQDSPGVWDQWDLNERVG